MARFALVCIALLGLATGARAQVTYFGKGGPGRVFSDAVRVGNILYLSGQIGSRPGGGLPTAFDEQARQVMENISATLRVHGLTTNDLFKCTVMLADMSKWQDFNKIYVGYFKPDRLPARSAFGASGLALGAQLEVECWAYIDAK